MWKRRFGSEGVTSKTWCREIVGRLSSSASQASSIPLSEIGVSEWGSREGAGPLHLSMSFAISAS